MVVDYSSYEYLVFVTYLICGYVISWVFLMLFGFLISFGYRGVSKLDPDSDWMEFMWTMVPITAVSGMCFANMTCMLEDDTVMGYYYINVIARQWYWTYSDARYGGNYDSIMNDFVGDVEKPMRLYEGYPVILCMTSADVIHSMALPEFFFKADIMPGRLSYHMLVADGYGVSVGYCSELCGAGHAYMPIVAESIEWLIPGKKKLPMPYTY